MNMHEHLSPEEEEAQKKGLALVARIEHLYKTDEGFRRWYDTGFEEIEKGEVVDITADVLRTENRLLREVLGAIFAHPMVSDVRRCRSCGVPVIHMEHLKLDEALVLESKARTLLGQHERYEEED